MSFILDALRKSEHARQHASGATLAELPLGRRARGLPWWVFALAALLLVNLIALALVLVRTDRSENVERAPLATTPAAPLPSQLPPVTPRQASPSQDIALAEEAALPPNVRYETVPRNESPLADDAPDGPTLVKRIAPAPVNSAPTATTANGLPEFHIDMHVYAPAPKDRFVFINSHKYIEGQALAEGPRVVEITADGVILLYRGEQLHLPRP